MSLADWKMAAKADSVEERFRLASDVIKRATKLKLNNDDKLKLYAFFKQSENGPCTTPKPGFFDMVGKAKWEAWKSLGDMAKHVAMQQYILLVSSLLPDWEQQVQENLTSNKGHTNTATVEESGSGGGGGSGGPSVSVLARTEEVLKDEEKSLFDWCKEGNVKMLGSLLDSENINHQDDNGMTLLHWACDRGHLQIVQLLADKGGNLNMQDTEGQAPLHYASSCGHGDIITFLMSRGADVNIKDNDMDTPKTVAMDDSTERLFS